ncbi:MAG: ATPase domain-containing protein [Candidatus ainarchaeum sp.]|nr:ATPase domain-containing protein [Candidatus ainarchaeum sp.]
MADEIERIQTGIRGFDSFVEGGFPKGSITLVVGTPGTGKSIFVAETLFNNALKGKKCLYLNLEQGEGKLEKQIRQFGWDLEKAGKNLRIVSVDFPNPGMVEFVLEEVQRLDYDMIAIDSLDSISSSPLETDEVGKMGMDRIAETVIPTLFDAQTVGRLKLKKIFAAISRSRATAFLTTERIEGAQGITRDTISEFLCDNILVLYYMGVGSSQYRTAQIIKMRLSNHEKEFIPFEITKKGIEIRAEK